MMVENTPIDYLDFASQISGLGSKMGLDATNKWSGETQRGLACKQYRAVALVEYEKSAINSGVIGYFSEGQTESVEQPRTAKVVSGRANHVFC